MTYDDYRALRRFPALDGLRAVAAVLVVVSHFGGPQWSWLTGWVGVHIFFVLSGFLITTLALREEGRRGRLSLRSFYVRRGMRILPVYVVVLAAVVGLLVLRGEWAASGMGPLLSYYLSFNGEFLPSGAPHHLVWTLGVEQKFYLVWPLLAFAVVLTARRRLALASSMVLSILALCAVHPYFVSYVPIMTGCLVAVVLHTRRGFALCAPLTRPAAAILVTVVFGAAHLALPAGLAWFGGEPAVILLYTVPVGLLLVSLLGRGPAAWVLARRPLVFVGERSYSLYLVQGLAGTVVAAVVPALAAPRSATLVAVLVVALLMADLLYRWVEVPCIELGRRWTARPRRAVDHPPAEPGAPSCVGSAAELPSASRAAALEARTPWPSPPTVPARRTSS